MHLLNKKQDTKILLKDSNVPLLTVLYQKKKNNNNKNKNKKYIFIHHLRTKHAKRDLF